MFLSIKFKGACIKLIILAFLCDKFVMVSTLDNLAMLEHADDVCIADG